MNSGNILEQLNTIRILTTRERYSERADKVYFSGVFFQKQNLVLSPVFQCYQSCNCSRDILEAGVTSTLCDALFRVTYRTTGKGLAKEFALTVVDDQILVLLNAAAKASSIAWFVTRRNVLCNLSLHFREKLRYELRDR